MGSVVHLKNHVNNSYSELRSSVEDKLILVEEKIKTNEKIFYYILLNKSCALNQPFSNLGPPK